MNEPIESSGRETWKRRVGLSAIWAAYGDALGFITELSTPEQLRIRSGRERISQTCPWSRRIGGKYGTTVQFPEGSYSDDTQLRLAVSRSTNADGYFNVDAFAAVELAAWLSYALGAGISTSVAAESAAGGRTEWNANFYEKKSTRYIDAGGNGAAMRVQPHVWALSLKSNETDLLKKVLRDCLSTHGHPTALIGAAFHALCLLHAMTTGQIPRAADWKRFMQELRTLPSLISQDSDLNFLWLPMWRNHSHTDYKFAFEKAFDSADLTVRKLADLKPAKTEHDYRDTVRLTGGFEPQTRGSGTGTSFVAAFIAMQNESDPKTALEWAANCLGSDTDTIASMAGALLGAVAECEPDGPLVDAEYIRSEGDRLSDIRFGVCRRQFAYPQLESALPKFSRLDGVRRDGDTLKLLGLGILDPVSEATWSSFRKDEGWQWMRLSFGQTVLCKRRREIGRSSIPVGKYVELPQGSPQSKEPTSGNAEATTVSRAFDRVLDSQFDPTVIGQLLLELSSLDDGVDKTVAFSALVSKAKRSREERRRKQ